MKHYDLVADGRPLEVQSDDGVVVCKLTIPAGATQGNVGVGNNSYDPSTAAGIDACLSKTEGQMKDWDGRKNLARQINPGLSASWNFRAPLTAGDVWYVNITGAKASGILVTLHFRK